MPSSAFSPHKYYRLEGFSSDISFITAFQSLLTEKVILIIFFFSVNELFKKKKINNKTQLPPKGSEVSDLELWMVSAACASTCSICSSQL